MNTRSVTFTHLFLLLFVLRPASAQTFGDFLVPVLESPDSLRQAMVHSYLKHRPQTPFIDSDSVVTFVYVGNARTVSIAGDMTGWNPTVETMTRLPGTTLWYLTRRFEPDARLDYKIVVDQREWLLDPHNPLISRGGFGDNSELRMPQVPDHPELMVRPSVPHGTIRDTTLYSPGLGNSRRLAVYIPATTIRDPGLIVVHDGLEFISIAGMPTVLDNLIADGAIPPVVAVFIAPVDRHPEYATDKADRFTSFVVETVLPMVRSIMPFSSDPSRNAVMGASDGGNISLYMGMTHPEIFGTVAAFSSNVEPVVSDRFASSERLPLRIYIDIGTYDIPMLRPRVAGLRASLTTKGYDYLYAEFHDGHSWSNWKSHVADALRFLLSPGQ